MHVAARHNIANVITPGMIQESRNIPIARSSLQPLKGVTEESLLAHEMCCCWASPDLTLLSEG